MTKTMTRAETLVEEGAAFMHLAGLDVAARARPEDTRNPAGPALRPAERFDVIVIGAGQAGLSVGYHLARRSASFVILDANERIGDTWRRRWDSLRLFTPARYDGLDGMRFPARGTTFPTKDQMADYLEAYAARYALPVRTGTRADRLWHDGERYVVSAGDQRFEAENVVLAMSSYQKARVPAFARELDPAIVQVHSIDYRNPAQLRE